MFCIFSHEFKTIVEEIKKMGIVSLQNALKIHKLSNSLNKSKTNLTRKQYTYKQHELPQTLAYSRDPEVLTYLFH